MISNVVDPNFVADWEDVARILFSPLFISEGILSQRAFMLEDASGETYISVLRVAVIPEHPEIKFDVLPRNAGKRKSHAGIFTTIDNKRVKGGMPQTPARMLARMTLVNIAQSNIHQL